MTTTISADNGSVSGSAGLKMSSDSSGVLALQTGANSTAMTLDTSGNVGIGTASPAQRLDVVSSSGFTPFKFKSSYSQAGLLGTDNSAIWMGVGSDGLVTRYRVDATNDVLTMHTGSTERMRIDSSGNLLVGVTSTLATGSPFQVSGPVAYSTCVIKVGADGNGAFVFRNAANTTAGSIGVNTSSTTYATSSDYRLKESIAPMTGALAKVAQLKPVTYKWKVDGSDGEGFIAHELAEVKPDCVSGDKDAVDADGNPVYQGIDTSFLVATLTAAIQELKAINDTQAETINALTARIVALEGQ